MIFLRYLILFFVFLTLTISCAAKKQSAKQNFIFKISALQIGHPIAGGSFVRGISTTTNNLFKLDANDSATFDFGNWEFQVVSFEGPTAFGGKRYCGKVKEFIVDVNPVDATLNLTEANCLVEPFISLIAEINSKFNNNAAVTVSNILPSSGALAGGTLVTITGTGFLTGATVDIGGSACSPVTVVNLTTITCTLPSHAAGSTNITVTNPDTQFGNISSAYIYQVAPTLISILPSAGALSGGTTVTLTGTGFITGANVTFDGSPCTAPIVNSSSSITCTTPLHTTGAVDVIVINSDSQSGTALSAFAYQPAPTITNVSPNSGNQAGGTPITITGTNFLAGATIDIGGTTCLSIIVVNSTTITCTTDLHTPGNVGVKITNTDSQNATLASAFLFQDTTAPNVTGLAFTDGDSEWSKTQTPTLNWNAATDSQSGVSYYEIALGTTSGNTNIQNWTNVGNVTNVQLSGLNLTRGQTYYASIRATDNNANTSSVVLGDGWLVNNEMWTTNGLVNAIIKSGNKLYLGGDFSAVSTWAGGGIPINISTGLTDWPNPLNKARVSGTVYTSVADGSGGFYIGGSFISINGIARNNLAHILADGTVDLTWNPNVNASLSPVVKKLIIDGGLLYIGGYFTTINGATTRNNLAAIDLATGIATAWNPNVNASIQCMIINGGTIYIGGQFFNVNGSTVRNKLAALDLTTGLATAWDPNVNNTVLTLAINGTSIYVGGEFTALNGGTVRNRLAEISLINGIATTWDPNIVGTVNTIGIDGTNIFVGGNFLNVNGSTPRYGLAEISLTTGVATAWNANIGGYINTLSINGPSIYIGGTFTTVNGSTFRNYLAELDITTSTATAWDPNMKGAVTNLEVGTSTIYIGGAGYLSPTEAVVRKGVVEIDLTTGAATSLVADVNGIVNALAINGNNLYIGGSFSNINGTTRHYLGSINVNTGVLNTWNPMPNSNINALVLDATTLFVGGAFTSVNSGGANRSRLASFNLATGIVTNWDPSADNTIYTLLVDGTQIYAGGMFTTINGGTVRNHLTQIDTSTGIASAWDPNINNYVRALAVNGTTLYAGGNFTTVNGSTTRNRIAALDTSTGIAKAWNPNVGHNGSTVYTITTNGSNIFLGGDFYHVNGGSTTRVGAAAIDSSTAIATSWYLDNQSSGTMFSIFSDGPTIYTGGSYNMNYGNRYFSPVDFNTGTWLPGF